MMSKFLLYVSYALFFYLIYIFLIYLFQRSLLYFPSKTEIRDYYYSETDLKKVNIYGSNGIILKSLFRPPLSKKDTFLIFHGNAGHIGHRVNKFKPFLDAGYGMLLLEYRGYGENSGSPTEKGLYTDAKAAINYLKNLKILPKNIIIYGESLGTGIAVKVSTEFKFHSTILEAPFTSISDVARRHYWVLAAKLLVLDDFNIIDKVAKIKSPLLVIHGEKDKIVNVDFGKKVFASASNPKKAIFVPTAGHNNLYEFDVDKKILNFLKK